jgi:hypothetical protein
MTSRGTYAYTDVLDCPDGQVEWTRSGKWYDEPTVYYPNEAAYPGDSGSDDDDPAEIAWHPDDGPSRKWEDMPPAFKVLVLALIERYQDAHNPEWDDSAPDYDDRGD